MPAPLRFLSAPCAFAAALMAGLALLPARAQACTPVQVVLAASYPRRGAVDVPTNAVLFIYGPNLRSADAVRLLDTTSGESLPFEVHAAPSGLDLTPLDALAPNREYQLADAEHGPILEFTTGSTPAAPAPALSAPKVDATVLEYFYSSCGLRNGLCLEVPDQPGTTLEVRVGEEVLRDYGAPWPMYRAPTGGPISDTECVEVRVRDALGHRSEPTVACGAAVRRVEIDNPSSEATCANYSDFIKASTPSLGPDGRPLPPERGSPPLREMSPEPQPVNATDVAYASDGAEAMPRGSGASAGCVLTRAGSGAPSLAGLGLALAAALAARRRQTRR